jgi:hypothetical protein
MAVWILSSSVRQFLRGMLIYFLVFVSLLVEAWFGVIMLQVVHLVFS